MRCTFTIPGCRGPRHVLYASLAVCLSVGTARFTGAQAYTPVTVPDQPSCGACTVTLSKWLSLQATTEASRIFNIPYSVSIDAQGRIFVSRGPDGPPIVFDSTGKFLRAMGGVGDGPNEFRGVRRIMNGPRDSVFIVDAKGSRYTVYDPNLRYLRSAPVPHGATDAALTARGLVIAAEAHGGAPFHLFDRIGNFRKSVGAGRTIIPGHTPPLSRWLTPQAGGGFISAAIFGQYLIESWDEDGALKQGMLRTPSWFPQSAPPYGMTPARTQGPAPQVMSIRQDAAGYLWVVLRLQDPKWKDAIRWDPNRRGEMALVPIIDDEDRAYDSHIEVLDMRTNKVVASKRFDEVFLGFAKPNVLYRFRVTDDGESTVDLYNIALQGLARQPR